MSRHYRFAIGVELSRVAHAFLVIGPSLAGRGTLPAHELNYAAVCFGPLAPDSVGIHFSVQLDKIHRVAHAFECVTGRIEEFRVDRGCHFAFASIVAANKIARAYEVEIAGESSCDEFDTGFGSGAKGWAYFSSLERNVAVVRVPNQLRVANSAGKRDTR